MLRTNVTEYVGCLKMVRAANRQSNEDVVVDDLLRLRHKTQHYDLYQLWFCISFFSLEALQLLQTKI